MADTITTFKGQIEHPSGLCYTGVQYVCPDEENPDRVLTYDLCMQVAHNGTRRVALWRARPGRPEQRVVGGLLGGEHADGRAYFEILQAERPIVEPLVQAGLVEYRSTKHVQAGGGYYVHVYRWSKLADGMYAGWEAMRAVLVGDIGTEPEQPQTAAGSARTSAPPELTSLADLTAFLGIETTPPTQVDTPPVPDAGEVPADCTEHPAAADASVSEAATFEQLNLFPELGSASASGLVAEHDEVCEQLFGMRSYRYTPFGAVGLRQLWCAGAPVTVQIGKARYTVYCGTYSPKHTHAIPAVVGVLIGDPNTVIELSYNIGKHAEWTYALLPNEFVLAPCEFVRALSQALTSVCNTDADGLVVSTYALQDIGPTDAYCLPEAVRQYQIAQLQDDLRFRGLVTRQLGSTGRALEGARSRRVAR